MFISKTEFITISEHGTAWHSFVHSLPVLPLKQWHVHVFPTRHLDEVQPKIAGGGGTAHGSGDRVF